MWNYLSSYVVSAEFVNCSKNRLDNFRAEFYGTGNCSEAIV